MMIENLNHLDYVIIAILLVSMALAFIRGFTRETLSIGSWIGAIYIAFLGSPFVQPYLIGFISNSWIAEMVSLFLIFLVSLIIFSILGNYIATYLQKTNLSFIDRLLGMIFGSVRGAIIILIGYFTLLVVLPEKDQPEMVTQSQSLPYLKLGVQAITAILPTNNMPFGLSDIEEVFQEQRERGKDALKNSSQPVENEIQKKQEQGYSKEDRALMDHLIDATQGDTTEKQKR